MKKKFVSLLLAACMLLSILPMGAVSAHEDVTSGTCGENVTWELNLDSGELLISGNGPMADYNYDVAPWYQYADRVYTIRILDGVTTAGAHAFISMTAVKYIEIAGTVSIIKDLAFMDCVSLETLILNEGLKYIDHQAFENCGMTEVTLPASVETVFSTAFGGCRNLHKFTVAEGNPSFYADEQGVLYYIEEGIVYLMTCPASMEGACEIPAEVGCIAAWAFNACDKLESIVIPEGVDTIAQYAFAYCSALTQVVLPASVAYIGQAAFDNCDSLEKILVAEDNAYFCNDAQGVLFTKDMTELVQYPAGRAGHYDVPAGVRSIGNRSFTNCNKITSLSLPETVEIIENSAFFHSGNLTEIHLSEGLKKIDKYSFYFCGIQNIVIPSTVEEIGADAFIYTNLKNIVVLNSDCEIGDAESTFGQTGYTTVYGFSGSTAEAYARKYGYTFESLDNTDCENGKHIFVNELCVLCGAFAVIDNIVINHSLNLENDIALNYLVHESYVKDFDAFYMEVTVPAYEDGDLSYSYQLDAYKSGEYYYFHMFAVTAVQINDILHAKLVMIKDGQRYCSTVDSYSIATYAYNQLGKANAPEGLKKVCAELLRYGATAQLYKEYRTDALADERLTDAQKSYLTDLSTVTYNDCNRVLEDVEEPTVKWAGVTLDLQSRVTLRYVVDLTDYTGALEDLRLDIMYTDIYGDTCWRIMKNPEVFNAEKNWYAFDVSYFGLTEMRTVMTARVYEDGAQPVSCSKEYSIDTYCNGKDGLLGELCAAMIAMSDSATDYFIN